MSEQSVDELLEEARQVNEASRLLASFSKNVQGLASKLHSMAETADSSQAMLESWLEMFSRAKNEEEQVVAPTTGKRKVTIVDPSGPPPKSLRA
mmetsp:Transcript_21649/g.33886  ORF Transcript_21649/g.33886 Transcript_21649/m.33886 type:complete len:94 (+) Transcript_21649:230-511(+)